MEETMGTDDTSGDKQGRVATFSIKLLFRHPTMDPADITKVLGVQPSSQWRVGEPVIGIDGKVRRGINRDSRWGLWTSYYDKRELDIGEEGPDVSERLARFLEPLARQISFVRQLAVEGDAAIDLNFPGQFHFGCSLSPIVLRTIADLGLNLGFEVFPDSAS